MYIIGYKGWIVVPPAPTCGLHMDCGEADDDDVVAVAVMSSASFL